MPEIADFVKRRALAVTPSMVDHILRHLPSWKLEFTQINQPLLPHLVQQLEFLADVVEDVAEGDYKDLPYQTFAEAVVALMYAHNKIGIIPDFIPNLNYTDRSSVVRAVLIQHEFTLGVYAGRHGIEWSTITSEL